MYIDNETNLVTNTQFDLGALRVTPGEKINMFAWGMAEGDVVFIYPYDDSQEAFSVVAGPKGCVNFELPSSVPDSIFPVFTGSLAVVMDSNVGHEPAGVVIPQ